MPQVLRDNVGDARVVDDVAALVAAYDDDAVAAAAERAVETRQADLDLLRELFARDEAPREPLVRRARRHVARHRTYYVVAALVVAVLLFRSPEPLPRGDSQDAASHLIPTIDADQVVTDATTPDVSAPLDFSAASPFPLDAPTDFGELTVIAPTDKQPIVTTAPAVLRFAQTGYASTLAGTPLDTTPPSNGLPVETTAGQVTKYSYARLTGGGAVLRLKAVSGDGASVNPQLARVQLCHITTAGWTPSRGTRSSHAPSYNSQCLEGAVKSGLWTFTFSSIFNPLDPNGWAIVPYLDGNATFRVTFAPTAQA